MIRNLDSNEMKKIFLPNLAYPRPRSKNLSFLSDDLLDKPFPNEFCFGPKFSHFLRMIRKCYFRKPIAREMDATIFTCIYIPGIQLL